MSLFSDIVNIIRHRIGILQQLLILTLEELELAEDVVLVEAELFLKVLELFVLVLEQKKQVLDALVDYLKELLVVETLQVEVFAESLSD